MKKLLLVTIGMVLCRSAALAWDYEGHRAVNQLALASLPPDFPQFVQTPAAKERVAFLAGEPDRWRNVSSSGLANPELPLSHYSGPDHYFDVEQLAPLGLKPETLPNMRYDFIAHIARERAAHPEKFPPIDQSRNQDHTRELVGLAPWAIVENYGKLKAGFSYLKAFQQHGGTGDEIANAEQSIIYIMGVMGHYVGDCAQPLHTTEHHHGWVGPNPKNYSTRTSIHSWIDGGYFGKVGAPDLKAMQKNIRPAQLVSINGEAAKPEMMFRAVVKYIVEQNKQVEPLYEMEKSGKFSGDGTVGLEGKPFLEAQMVKGGQMLGDIWFSAWKQAPPDQYLQSQLAKRKLAQEKKAKTKP